jgi:hypothetical protein
MKWVGRVLLNIFYTLAIILLTLSAIWSFNHSRYDLLLGAVFCLSIVVYLKIRLAKQVKQLLK